MSHDFGYLRFSLLLDSLQHAGDLSAGYLNRGRKTDIDWINGAVVELAKTVHEETPVNDAWSS